MQREMTKTEKILNSVVLTNLSLIVVAISTIFMNTNNIDSMPIIIRHVFSFLRYHVAEFSLLSFGIMLIAGFWSAALGDLLDNREQEHYQSYVQKYVLSNESNTKSRLELTKLKERGY